MPQHRPCSNLPAVLTLSFFAGKTFHSIVHISWWEAYKYTPFSTLVPELYPSPWTAKLPFSTALSQWFSTAEHGCWWGKSPPCSSSVPSGMVPVSTEYLQLTRGCQPQFPTSQTKICQEDLRSSSHLVCAAAGSALVGMEMSWEDGD